ncbi:MAG: hypothetical protein L3J56_02125 [Bacteroidales bacterium]|nr:hypothetical protein [Bacteroidales bacterium]
MTNLKFTYQSDIEPQEKTILRTLTLNKSLKTVCSVYRFGYQGSEKDDEIYGSTGTAYTTHFRGLDTRVVRWWSIDPKTNLTPWESPYASMGLNPIWHNDPLGDIWGKPGDKADNKDKKQADKMKQEFSVKRDEYKSSYESLNQQITDFSGDKSSPEYADLCNQRQEAYTGMMDMQSAIKEIDEIGADKNYYTFHPTNLESIGRTNLMTADKNNDGTFTVNINYQWGSSANKVHETRHAADVARGLSIPDFSESNSTDDFFGNRNTSERRAYARQYFYDKSSMPIRISTYKQLYHIENYLQLINKKYGKRIY